MKSMKWRRIFALILAFCLTAGSLTACGETAPSGKADTADAIAEEDIVMAEDEEPAAPTPTPEPVFVDPYQDAAKKMISTAYDYCRTGAEIAASLADQSRALADSYEKEDYDAALESCLAFCEEQLPVVSRLSNDAANLTSLSSVMPESQTGRKIRAVLERLLKELSGSLAQVQDLISFYQEQNALYNEYMDIDGSMETSEEAMTFIADYYYALYDLQSEYQNMKKPALIADLWDKNTNRLALAAESMNYSYTGLLADSTLDTYIFTELSDYADILAEKYETSTLQVMAEGLDQTSEILADTYPGILDQLQTSCKEWTDPSITRSASPVFEYNMIGKVYPNGYPALDSVINLTASTTAEKQDVIISAEIQGFTQEYRQKVTLTTKPQHFMIKPPTLISLPDLSTKRNTQLKFTITDNETGKILVQDSKNITLYSIYDFFWYTDEFGMNSAFDILGWLRPESNAVTAINRQAISYLESIGISDALVGYQYAISQDEELNTLIQVAAIQKAISDLGVRYTLDDYSFAAQQHVLTADQVLAKKTGLCIESSLLMASCLMSAGFHAMILLIPGHAQVAVETWNGSNGRTGEYFLIETTDLPYGGFLTPDGNLDFGDAFPNQNDPSSAWWKEYISTQDGAEIFDGDVFVIDCDLRSLMNLQGLESIQADLRLDPVVYPDGSGISIVDTTPEDEPIKEEDVKPAEEAAAEGGDTNVPSAGDTGAEEDGSGSDDSSGADGSGTGGSGESGSDGAGTDGSSGSGSEGSGSGSDGAGTDGSGGSGSDGSSSGSGTDDSSGADGSGTGGSGSGSDGASDESAANDYITVTSANEDFTFIVRDDVTGTIYDNSVVIYPLGNDTLPLMLISRVYGQTTDEFLTNWIDMVADDNTVQDKPTEIMTDDFGDFKVYSIEYLSTDAYGTVDNFVVALPVNDSDIAVFYLMMDNDSDDETMTALIENFYLALFTFTAL